jgi:hypothetical protein
VLLAVACANPAGPTAGDGAVDVLDYVLGAPELWPRVGDQSQHQIVDAAERRVTWTKYSLGWMFESWRWDDQWMRHEVDHGIDRRRWEHYTFSDGRWLPRWLPPAGWSLDVADNRITWVDRECRPQPERPFPYRVRAWIEPTFDAGGDLGVRDTLVLEYEPYDPLSGGGGSAERFHFARGAGWFLWTRADGARVAFNRRGGSPRAPTGWCANGEDAFLPER